MSYTMKPSFAATPRITARQIQIADRWHLVRVCERRVFETAALLREMRMPVYAPLQTYRKRKGRSRVKLDYVEAEHPAFFNYLFVGFRGRADWWAMFETGLVRAIVVCGGEPVALTQGQIASIAIRQARGDFDFRDRAMMAAAFKAGDRVRVVNDRHVLYGREYTARSVKDGRISVLLDFLGKKQLFELAVDDVDKAA